ncbi:YjiH family protein [Fictibacillus nanhaiensis]|uniref:YjiH family protein n=1 Tax=Fictibacillus nanhaiensis TaxID=742169 RepID=UPI001C95919A|nr:YjiH family protein [Fictibacillus nanhaiensis]MBY6037508.1 YjiH family protein [Fictibacillus nanhaiensis]
MELQKQQIDNEVKQQSLSKFIIPSLIGIFLFMIPISYNDEITIPVAIFAGVLQDVIGNYIPQIMTIIIGLTVLGSLITYIAKPKFIIQNTFLEKLFNVHFVWQLIRVVGFIFAVMTLYKIGPEAIWSENTGQLLLYDLIPVLFSVFLFAGLFLPLLFNFGLLEFCGAMLVKIMRPVFKLPGRSSIDCLASWLGDGTIGVLLTNKQYEQGYYTKREAAVIGTTFSVVSITFAIVVLAQVKLAHMIVPYYLTVVLAGLVCAIIIPRIPPLSRKPDTYYEGAQENVADEVIPEGETPFRFGLKKAVDRADQNQKAAPLVKEGIQNVLDMWMGVVPIVMAIGTSALIVAEFTPFFTYLGAPFVPILELLQVPQATEAAQTIVIGFADMFLPSIIGAGIESELTRFVIAAMSVIQLIYMSEVGGLLLASKVPVNFKDLVIIFFLRTIISLPIVVGMAHLFF